MPRCSTSHVAVPVIAPTCSDHFQPGSYRARPIVIPPICDDLERSLVERARLVGRVEPLDLQLHRGSFLGASVAAVSARRARRRPLPGLRRAAVGSARRASRPRSPGCRPASRASRSAPSNADIRSTLSVCPTPAAAHERREVHVLRRHEQPVALREVPLIERAEDRAASVVRATTIDQFRREPRPFQSSAPASYNSEGRRSTRTSGRSRRSRCRARWRRSRRSRWRRGSPATWSPSRGAIATVEVPDRHRVPDEQRAPFGDGRGQVPREAELRGFVGRVEHLVHRATAPVRRRRLPDASQSCGRRFDRAGPISRPRAARGRPQSPRRRPLGSGSGWNQVDHEEPLGGRRTNAWRRARRRRGADLQHDLRPVSFDERRRRDAATARPRAPTPGAASPDMGSASSGQPSRCASSPPRPAHPPVRSGDDDAAYAATAPARHDRRRPPSGSGLRSGAAPRARGRVPARRRRHRSAPAAPRTSS